MLTPRRRPAAVIALSAGIAFAPALARNAAALTRDAELPNREKDLATVYLSKGQDALSRDQYQAAIEAFREAGAHAGDPALTAEALYWLAFSLSRRGETADLRAAQETLEELLRADTAHAGLDDAAELMMSIRGEMARRGDAEAAAHLAAKAEELARQAAMLDTAEAKRLQAESRLMAEEALRAAGLLHDELALSDESMRDLLALPHLARDAEQEDDVRITALQALADTDKERALPILKSVLERRDEGSARLREKAVVILSLHKSEESERLLLDAARNDPDPWVRERALYHLGGISSDEALKVLEETLLGSGDSVLREQALKGLVMQDAPRILQTLRDVASRDDMPAGLRERAIQMLGWKGSDEDLSFLRRLYDQVAHPSLKEAIVMAVGQKQGSETRAWLLRLIGDASDPPAAREKAFFWAGEDQRVPTEELVTLYDRLERSSMRKQAVHVIGRRKDEAALSFLLRTARSGSDPEARQAAIFWLGQSDDPRAAECLEEIISR